MDGERKIAYFSMEIGFEEGMPTYSGGLGILAGDTVRSGADMKIPMVAISLLYRKGYFYQRLEKDGTQSEEPVEWEVDDFVEPMAPEVVVTLNNRTVRLRAWRYNVTGVGGFVVPVYFLDADIEQNNPQDRTLTHFLYGKDLGYRLSQEAILGIGGVRMLAALGYNSIERFHMNEGHASLLTLELLERQAARREGKTITQEDIDAVRKKCVFTTHTPVPAGHDQFPMDMVNAVIGRHKAMEMPEIFCCGGVLNMTYTGLNLSHYINGVAKKHGETSQHMFGSYDIDSITNGVHVRTWTSRPFGELYDKYIPGWREDNFSLRYALSIPSAEIEQAHTRAKRELIEFVNRLTNVGMDTDYLTIGFARRSTSYKRPDLLFTDMERLRSICRKDGKIQVIYAGKAHPKDQAGKDLIKRIFESIRALKDTVKIVYLENYDVALGGMMTAGVDVWLNTPEPPMEASGTSGMKAAINGVPSLSILDGWWIEGCIEDITGWAIGQNHRLAAEKKDRRLEDAEHLYTKLEHIVEMFYKNRPYFVNIMLHSIALNGSFFNTQRMMQQYVVKAYFE